MGPTDGIAVRHIAGFEDALDVPFRVIADPCRRNVGSLAIAAFLIRSAGEALVACDDGAEQVARTVALRAVSWAVDEIRAAVPLRRS